MIDLVFDLLFSYVKTFDLSKALILLRSFYASLRRPRGRYQRRFRLRLPRWLYRIKSAIVDALVIGGGVAVLLLVWTYFFT